MPKIGWTLDERYDYEYTTRPSASDDVYEVSWSLYARALKAEREYEAVRREISEFAEARDAEEKQTLRRDYEREFRKRLSPLLPLGIFMRGIDLASWADVAVVIVDDVLRDQPWVVREHDANGFWGYRRVLGVAKWK